MTKTHVLTYTFTTKLGSFSSRAPLYQSMSISQLAEKGNFCLSCVKKQVKIRLRQLQKCRIFALA